MTLATATPADAELLRRYAEEGAEAAFSELVRRHLDVVHSAALRQVGGNSAAAADIAQAAFTELARQASRLARHTALVGWLYTTTHRLAVRHVRDESRRQRREWEAHAMQETHRSPDPEADWNRLAPVLDEAMHELAEADRIALLLRHFERRPFAEVGSRLGLNENAARMRVDRALDKLRARLAKRGITSTASALSVALGGPAVVAAPAGLAGGIVAATVAASGTASALGIWSLMASTKAKVALIALSSGLLGTGFWVQQRQLERMRRQHLAAEESLSAANSELAALRSVNADVSNRLTQSADVMDEVLRLRGEVARLRRERVGGIEEAPPAKREAGDQDLGRGTAGTVVSSSIPRGQLLLTGGWTAPSGKRVLVVIQHEIDSSGELPAITLSTTTLEADDDVLATKGFAEFLTPVSEQRPQRFISPADLQTMLNDSIAGMTLSASPKLTTYSGRQGSLALTQDGSDVAMNFDLVPYLATDGGLELTLVYGTRPVPPANLREAP